MKKNKINEGMLDSVDKFISAFFEGLRTNSSENFIKKAQAAKLPPGAIKTMQALKKNHEDLEKLIRKVNNAK